MTKIHTKMQGSRMEKSKYLTSLRDRGNLKHNKREAEVRVGEVVVIRQWTKQDTMENQNHNRSISWERWQSESIKVESWKILPGTINTTPVPVWIIMWYYNTNSRAHNECRSRRVSTKKRCQWNCTRKNQRFGKWWSKRTIQRAVFNHQWLNRGSVIRITMTFQCTGVKLS